MQQVKIRVGKTVIEITSDEPVTLPLEHGEPGRRRKLSDSQVAELAPILESGSDWNAVQKAAAEKFNVQITATALHNYPELKAARRKGKAVVGRVHWDGTAAEAE